MSLVVFAVAWFFSSSRPWQREVSAVEGERRCPQVAWSLSTSVGWCPVNSPRVRRVLAEPRMFNPYANGDGI